MKQSGGNRTGLLRLSGIGFEFAGAVIGFMVVGYWIGRQFDNAQTGLLIGAVLGIVGGGYNMIRASLKAVKDAAADDDDRKTE